jgi:hypothetical protein
MTRPTQGRDQEAEGGINRSVPCAKTAMMRVWVARAHERLTR